MTRITYTLNAPARVLFVVRGPAPSCQVAGRFRARGNRGANHVRFNGRVGRRMLPYGTYRVTARTRGKKPSRPITVVVGAGSASTSGFACSAPTPSSDVFASITGTFSAGGTGARPGASNGSAGTPNQASPAAKPAAEPAAKAKPDRGVLPAISEKVQAIPEALPRPSIPSATSPPWIVGVVALGLLGLSLIAIVIYVIRFLRRTDVKSA